MGSPSGMGPSMLLFAHVSSVPLWRHMQPMQMNVRVVGSRIDFPVVQPIPGKVFCYGVGVVLADRGFRFVPQCVDQGQKHFVASFDP